MWESNVGVETSSYRQPMTTIYSSNNYYVAKTFYGVLDALYLKEKGYLKDMAFALLLV